MARDVLKGAGHRYDEYMSIEASGAEKATRIASDLRELIASGQVAPGERLPGENALMQRYDVARMTARNALGMLKNEGLTVTRKGVGVFVREFRPVIRNGIQRVKSDTWGMGRAIWESDTDGRTLTVHDFELTTGTDLPDEVSALLPLAAGGEFCCRSRLYHLDGKPVMIAKSYLPRELTAGTPIEDENPGPGGIYARLADGGNAPANFREDVRAGMPSLEEAAALRLEPGTPVIRIARSAVTAQGRTVEVNDMTLDASAYVLRYDFDA